MQEWYHWGWKPKRMTRKQINEMILNMKKSEIISKKSTNYHKIEEKEADNILKKLEKIN